MGNFLAGCLFDEAVREHKMRRKAAHARANGINPKKRILEEEYAINVPRRSTTATSSFPYLPVVPPSEFDDFVEALLHCEMFHAKLSRNVLAVL